MDVDPKVLAHWSRVALAAESAAIVHPLFDKAWPEASDTYRLAVPAAIELAARSARAGKACAGVKEAASNASHAAGRAQIPHLYDVPFDDDEQPPAGPNEAAIASMAAKAAQLAAEAASDESQSEEGLNAFYFALDAARQAKREDLVMRIWAAASDRVARERPWWKFW